MRKPRSDAKLLNLPEEQQAMLSDWLLSGHPLHQVRELVLKEFGVKTSLGALSGYYSQVCSAALVAKRTRAVGLAEDLATAAEATPGRFDSATIDSLKQKAFELAASPVANPRDVKNLFMLVLKARDQDLTERRIKLLEEKAGEAKLKLTQVVSRGGLTPETLRQIEEAAALL